MPIPRRNKEEFFISTVNKLWQEETSDQAIIYLPYEHTPAEILGNRRDIENLDEFITRINSIFSSINSIDYIHSDRNLLMIHIISDIIFYEYFRHFLRSNRSDNIVSLAYDLFIDIRDNSNITLLIGIERARNLKKAVFKYYKELLKQNQKEEKSKPNQKKTNFNIQFKEFKIHQNYVEIKIYKEIKNINVKKYQHYLRCLMRKNRNKVFCNHFVFNCFWYNTKTVIGKYFHLNECI